MDVEINKFNKIIRKSKGKKNTVTVFLSLDIYSILYRISVSIVLLLLSIV